MKQRRVIDGVDPFVKVYQLISDIHAKARGEEEGSRFFLDKYGKLWSSFNLNERKLICSSCGRRDCLKLSWFEIETCKQREISQAIMRMRSFVEQSNIVESGV